MKFGTEKIKRFKTRGTYIVLQSKQLESIEVLVAATFNINAIDEAKNVCRFHRFDVLLELLRDQVRADLEHVACSELALSEFEVKVKIVGDLFGSKPCRALLLLLLEPVANLTQRMVKLLVYWQILVQELMMNHRQKHCRVKCIKPVFDHL